MCKVFMEARVLVTQDFNELFYGDKKGQPLIMEFYSLFCLVGHKKYFFLDFFS